MSDNFNQKDYGDYFKALEENLNKPSKPAMPRENTVPDIRRKKNGIWWVFRLRPSVIAVFLVLVLVAVSVSVVAIVNGKKSSNKPESVSSKTTVSAPKEEKKKPISFSFSENVPAVPSTTDAKSAIIINKTANTVLAARNAHDKVYPASTTKVMTLLVAAENLTDLNDTFTMTLAITDPLFVRGASVAGFLNNETITMTDLLYGLILPSGADAAVALAVKIAGSEESFVNLMNQKAKELGLKNTHFANVSGLHDENNYTTAYDMSVILATALENELCKTILSTKKYTTSKTPQNPDGILLSSTLFDYMYGTEPEIATITSGKTGFVNESGYCIASYGTNNTNGNEYIVVTMGNSARRPAFHGQIALYKEFAK